MHSHHNFLNKRARESKGDIRVPKVFPLFPGLQFIMEWTHENFLVTDNPAAIDLDFVVTSLQSTYWAHDRSHDVIENAIHNSVVLSLFQETTQIGLLRIIGDRATFAWICDVFVAPEYRKQGLGKWLVRCAIEHPMTKVRLCLLATQDAHGLYQQFGFTLKECMARYQQA